MEKSSLSAQDQEMILELGIKLGERRTLGLIAGRCSAAQAQCLKKMHDEKMHVRFNLTWDEFCEKRLKMNRRTVDRIIGWFNEFGRVYFDAASLTGIAPAEYRRIAKSFQSDGIHVDGQVIALIPDNNDRAIEAIARLQAEAQAADRAKVSGALKQISELKTRGLQLGKAFRKVARSASDVERSVLRGSVEDVTRDLYRILAEFTV